MSAIPTLSPREVTRLLIGSGFHADGRATIVPFHKGRDIALSLLRKIARDIGLTVEELLGR